MKTLLKYENTKLKKQFIFNIPAGKETCGRECPGCYAIKPQKFRPTVLPARQRNFAASKQEDFASNVTVELTKSRRKIKAVRIHESGDFYSQDYVDKWLAVAKANPKTTFYAFTKRLADFDFTDLMARNNVVIINSLAHNKLNYGTIEFLKKHPCTNVCPATVKATKDTTICGVTCDFCMTKRAQDEGITFVQH